MYVDYGLVWFGLVTWLMNQVRIFGNGNGNQVSIFGNGNGYGDGDELEMMIIHVDLMYMFISDQYGW